MDEKIWIVKVEGSQVFDTDGVIVYAFHNEDKARDFMLELATKTIEREGKCVKNYTDGMDLCRMLDGNDALFLGEPDGDYLRLDLEQVSFEALEEAKAQGFVLGNYEEERQ